MLKIKKVLSGVFAIVFLLSNLTISYAFDDFPADTPIEIVDFDGKAIERNAGENETVSNRYIIKFKNNASIDDIGRKTKDKLGSVDVKKYKIRRNGKATRSSQEEENILFVETNEMMELDQFKGIISANENMSDIEYIQPDYVLTLSDIDEPTVMVEEQNSEENVESETSVENNEEIDLFEPVDEADETESDETTEEVIEEVPMEINSFDIEASLTQAHQTSTGAGITVALIDSVVDVNHTQLAGHIGTGWDFVNDTELVLNSDEAISDNHGTHIAGVIAKTAPDAVILPLKVFENGRAYTSDIIEAIEYAAETGVDLVNCSWGSSSENLALNDAMENSGLLFVCAAGNNRLNVDTNGIYPASYDLDNIISVGSINADGGMSYFSNYGQTVDITAWGREIDGLLPDDRTGTMTGTSVSAGFISGAAALVMSANVTAENVKATLMNTADKLSCLRGKAADGNKVNFVNAVTNTSGATMEIEAEDDFDVFGYQATPSENWDLFCSLDNVQVATGFAFTAVLKNDGTVWTFGSNYYGSLGNGAVINRTITSSSAPVQVVGLTNVVQIASGLYHVVALKDDGTVWAWGEYGGVSGANVPMQISGFNNIEKIAAGGHNSAVIDNNGLMTIIGSWPFTRTFNGAEQVALGNSFCLVLNTSGDVYACGYNQYGQLGLGDTTNRTTFTQVTELSDITDIYAAYGQAAAIDASGNLKIWGKNNAGQLGLGSFDNQLTPLTIPGMESVDKVALGEEHTLALTSDGKVWSWGNNSKGQLGIGTLESYSFPVSVNNFGSFNTAAELAAGQYHSAVIDESAKVYCFGANTYGQIGDGVPLVQTEPALATLAQDMTEFSAGSDENYGLREDGTVWKIDSVLTQVKNLSHIDTISNRLAVDENGYVWQWSDDLQAEKVEGLSNIKSVSRNGYHAMALTKDGTVYCWGNNNFGQLGNGTVVSSDVPVEVTALSNVDQIAAGLESSLARVGGTVYEWGRRAFVEYEYNPDTGEVEGPLYDAVPVQVAGITNAVSIASGTYHDLILKSDGKTYQWGYSAGDYSGAFTSVDTTNPNTIGAGFGLSVAVRPNVNHIFQWGNTSFEQWVDYFLDASNNASRVIMPSTIDKVFVGDYYVYAIADDGKVYSWGSNFESLLGNGRKQYYTLPSIVNGISNLGTQDDYHQLSSGDIIKGAITTEGTPDYYSFTAPASDGYTINVISDDNVQMKLYVYDPIGGIVEVEADAYKNTPYVDEGETIYIEIYQPDNQEAKYLLSVKPNEANKFYELTLDGYKYYTDYNNSGHLYKTDMTSGASNLLQAYLSKWLVTDDDYLYYVVRNGDEPGIYKMDIWDTTDVTKIADDNAFYLTLNGYHLYYSNWSDGGKIYRINAISGVRKEKVCDDEASNLDVVGDYVYYDNGHQGGKRYKVNKIPANIDEPVHGTPVN